MLVVHEHIPEILCINHESIQADREAVDMGLVVEDGDHKVEDDWLILCVYPTMKGIRQSEYSAALRRIEDKLETRGSEHITLVPIV